MRTIKAVICPYFLFLGLVAVSSGAEELVKVPRTKSPQAQVQKDPGPAEFEKAQKNVKAHGHMKSGWNLKLLLGYHDTGESFCGRYGIVLQDLQTINTAKGLNLKQFEIQAQWRLHLAWVYENCDTFHDDAIEASTGGYQVPPGCPDAITAIYPKHYKEAAVLYQQVGETFPKKYKSGKDLQRVANKLSLNLEQQFVDFGDEGDLCQALHWRLSHGYSMDAVLVQQRKVLAVRKLKTDEEAALKRAQEELAAQRKVQQGSVTRK